MCVTTPGRFCLSRVGCGSRRGRGAWSRGMQTLGRDWDQTVVREAFEETGFEVKARPEPVAL